MLVKNIFRPIKSSSIRLRVVECLPVENSTNVTNATSNEIAITLFPPINACEDNTDENSGDEDFVSLNNLPGNHLRAEAEISASLDEGDEDDNIPLSIIQLGCKKFKTYHWSNDDIKASEVQWPVLANEQNNLSPIELLCNFFDAEIVDLFFKYTHLYAVKKNKTGDVTTDENTSVFAILLVSDYVPLPRRRMFWETTSDTHNELVSRAMSRDRFEFIMSDLHCCDQLDKEDKFAKIRPFFLDINKKFLEFAVPTENHSIDECMVPYFGKHGCKQCIVNKPVRFGYWVWMDATSTGCVNWVEPYQGSKTAVKNVYRFWIGTICGFGICRCNLVSWQLSISPFL